MHVDSQINAVGNTYVGQLPVCPSGFLAASGPGEEWFSHQPQLANHGMCHKICMTVPKTLLSNIES